MPWALFVDQEAVDLMDAAAEMANAALEARSRRVDQHGMLKRSVDMSRIKLQGVRECFHGNPLIDFSEFSDQQQQQLFAAVEAIQMQTDKAAQDAIWKTIRVLVLQPGFRKAAFPGSQPWGDADLPAPTLERTATGIKEKPPKVRNVRLKTGKRATPQKASK